ncbi:MAG TPA: cupin [Elusimicrobia bacterium]|nr:MAG: cupin [Elusimicrobia bacterium RIFOXYA12_FULL_49_49]OGS08360.1 MAG: cupin [Elusimicrobia bacterium RIFOXYA1_FULL_47_7]OGS09623.1 MAG: cupin [Elusimicrobia bacterium RIFOXYB1_FULL_48_9]OGS16601.1 MAG: cupin [Elusimicrobia bacterium RIFOXYA2_FULL_47_53]OGS25826.1 MAG: cupin [Elusimicrobia bacterium RIFOXYB12_FULL_50_12]OGS31579.1 MAG: cupin [Elusimicrobia bacterium RIFOXYB2_FULL_46_23]HBU69024.1 cupin [Elusimicrobiota bacterium]
MNDFPQFMKNPVNAIAASSQSNGVEGFVFDGADGSQMAFWSCKTGGASKEHTHDFDEYMLVVEGCYTIIIHGKNIKVSAGGEYFIPAGVPHAGEFISGTRTIHAFGGRRAERAKR